MANTVDYDVVKEFLVFAEDRGLTNIMTVWKEYVEFTKNRDIKHMIIGNGRFGAISKSGHPIDVLKSAMQKFARRGKTDKMIAIAMEFDMFKYLGTNPATKSIRTNCLNRLKIIMFEDVSFSQFYVFRHVFEQLEKFEKRGRIEFECIERICTVISKAKKLRLPSHLNHAFKCVAQIDKIYTKAEFEDAIRAKTYSDGFWFIYQNPNKAEELLKERASDTPFESEIMLSLKEFNRLKRTRKHGEMMIFLVVPWLWIMHKENLQDEVITEEDVNEEIPNYKDIDLTELPDYVFDMHTLEGCRKGKTREDFIINGSYVTNEDEEFLVKEFLEAYEDQPPPPEEPKPKKGYKKQSNITYKKIVIPEKRIMITDGVCGAKVPCVKVTYDNKPCVLKQVAKGTNPLEYFFVNTQKAKFDIMPMEMEIVSANEKIVKPQQRVYKWEKCPNTLFYLMEDIKNKGDLGKHKKILTDETLFDNMLKIRLFNGLFNTSDNILRNILVDEDNNFYPIDEHDMLGKRKNVFNASEPIKRSIFFTKEKINSMIDSMDIERKLDSIIFDMKRHNLESKIDELIKRAHNYKTIVFCQLWD